MNKLSDIQQLKNKATDAASLLKALAHPERLMILCQLINTELNVGELCAQSQLSQSAFSQHLAVLRRDGLVRTRKEAQTVYYSIANDHVLKVLKVLQAIYC